LLERCSNPFSDGFSRSLVNKGKKKAAGENGSSGPWCVL